MERENHALVLYKRMIILLPCVQWRPLVTGNRIIVLASLYPFIHYTMSNESQMYGQKMKDYKNMD